MVHVVSVVVLAKVRILVNGVVLEAVECDEYVFVS